MQPITHVMKSKLNIHDVRMYGSYIILGNKHIIRNLYQKVQLFYNSYLGPKERQ